MLRLLCISPPPAPMTGILRSDTCQQTDFQALTRQCFERGHIKVNISYNSILSEEKSKFILHFYQVY